MAGITIDLNSIGFQKRIHPLALVTFPIFTVKQWCQWMFMKCKGTASVDIMNGLLSKMHLVQKKIVKKNIKKALKKYKNKDKSAEQQQLEKDLDEATKKIGIYLYIHKLNSILST